MVIIAAGPLTLRNGRRVIRSITHAEPAAERHGDQESRQQDADERQTGQDHLLTGQAERLQHEQRR